MTDIKTALSQALNEWETPKTEDKRTGKHLFKPTNNVTRATFDLIRANPGITRKETCKLLSTRGYKVSSTASLISAFVRQGQVELTDGKLFTTSNEYAPLKGGKDKTKAFKEAVAIIKTKPKKPYQGPIEAEPQPQATGITKDQSVWTNTRRVVDIDEWLSEVPLMQARMVYMRLKEIFEGETK
jgi:hypothetical protein